MLYRSLDKERTLVRPSLMVWRAFVLRAIQICVLTQQGSRCLRNLPSIKLCKSLGHSNDKTPLLSSTKASFPSSHFAPRTSLDVFCILPDLIFCRVPLSTTTFCLSLCPESRQLILYFCTIRHLHLHRQSSFTHCEPSHISRRNHYLPRHYHTTSVRSPSSSLSPYKWPPQSTAFPSNCSSRYSHISTISV